MNAASTLGFGESIIYSIVGLTVVFVALMTLAGAIVLCTKIFNAMGLTEDKPKAAVKPKEEDVSEEHCAVIMSALAEELRGKRGDYRIKSITEIK